MVKRKVLGGLSLLLALVAVVFVMPLGAVKADEGDGYTFDGVVEPTEGQTIIDDLELRTSYGLITFDCVVEDDAGINAVKAVVWSEKLGLS